MKKSKGDVQYYLEKEGNIFHLVKRVKTFSKKLTDGKTKATTKTVSDFNFTKNNFEDIDFNANGLREKDKSIIVQMVEEIEGLHAD
ncbi:hypothetical protein VKQ53_27180 [Escherichia coli]|uniref:hypothetical protein n=1 Tax=Escherichia coli TaxID=562 RepID=UPI00388F112B